MTKKIRRQKSNKFISDEIFHKSSAKSKVGSLEKIVIDNGVVDVGVGAGVVYHRMHFSGRFIGDPAGHWKVVMKSWELESGPRTRYLAGE